jgi:hypothetical protein
MGHGAIAGIAIGAVGEAALIAAGAFFLGRCWIANKTAQANRVNDPAEVKSSYPSGRFEVPGAQKIMVLSRVGSQFMGLLTADLTTNF